MIVAGNGGLFLSALLQQKSEQTKRQDQLAPRTADQERQAKAEEALNTLKQANASMRDQRKGAAAQKVQRLKQELQNLKMFAGGDPKAIARQAARIARELAAAAREYAAAGGGAPLGGADTVSSKSASATGQSDPAAEEGEGETLATEPDGEAITDADTDVQTQLEQDGLEEDGTLTDADSPDTQSIDEAQVEQWAAEAERQADEAERQESDETDDPREAQRNAIAEAAGEIVNDMARKAGEIKADSDFANDVRSLSRQIKALLEQQRRRAEQDDDKNDGEVERLGRQVDQADQELNQVLSGNVGITFPVNLSI